MTAQLMSAWDHKVQSSKPGPVALSALLAHLLFLAVNGGLETATALADTFGTEAFLQAALVTQLPQEFIEDVKSKSNFDVPPGISRLGDQRPCSISFDSSSQERFGLGICY